MGFRPGLNLFLLISMVATNIFSLYHLSSLRHHHHHHHSNPTTTTVHLPPDHLLRHLSTIHQTISHLTNLHHQQNPNSSSSSSSLPPELHRLTSLETLSYVSPIGTACAAVTPLLHRYMSYTPFGLCPDDVDVAEALIVRGCAPLPRRRCFSRTPSPEPSLPMNSFPDQLPSGAVRWSRYECKSFDCLSRFGRPGFDLSVESRRWIRTGNPADISIAEFFDVESKSESGPIRLGIDIGGMTGTFAARMKERNMTVVSTTLDFGAPYAEVAGARGVVTLHVALQERLPVYDGALDVVHVGRAVNRWVPLPAMEFLFYDADRVLRQGGWLWVDHFFCKAGDLNKVYAPILAKLGYRKVKWVTANKTDFSGLRHGEVFLNAILQKPLKSS